MFFPSILIIIEASVVLFLPDRYFFQAQSIIFCVTILCHFILFAFLNANNVIKATILTILVNMNQQSFLGIGILSDKKCIALYCDYGNFFNA